MARYEVRSNLPRSPFTHVTGLRDLPACFLVQEEMEMQTKLLPGTGSRLWARFSLFFAELFFLKSFLA
jgi:hypothetical protein